MEERVTGRGETEVEERGETGGGEAEVEERETGGGKAEVDMLRTDRWRRNRGRGKGETGGGQRLV